MASLPPYIVVSFSHYLLVRSPCATDSSSSSSLSQNDKLQYIHVFGVDNLLVKPLDPFLIGFGESSKQDIICKCTNKLTTDEDVQLLIQKDQELVLMGKPVSLSGSIPSSSQHASPSHFIPLSLAIFPCL